MGKIEGRHTPTNSFHGSMTLTISITFKLLRQRFVRRLKLHIWVSMAEVRQMADITFEFQWQRFVKWLKLCNSVNCTWKYMLDNLCREYIWLYRDNTKEYIEILCKKYIGTLLLLWNKTSLFFFIYLFVWVFISEHRACSFIVKRTVKH